MTNIDDLFKSHAASSSSATAAGTKRKLGASHNPADYYKSARTSRNGDVKGQQHASVQDASDEDDATGDDDTRDEEAGPQPGGEDDADDDDAEDEEGARFFGGGMTRSSAAALEYMEGDDDDGDGSAPERIDAAWVRRTATALERHIARNAEQRAKHADEPARFMASEGELDAAVKAVSLVAEHAGLYGDFAASGAAGALVGLLGHENTDIAINAIEILAELTDENVQAEQAQWDALTDALFEADLPGLLIENLARLNEDDEADRPGVYHSLSLLENLVSQTGTLEKTITESKVLPWLISRIERVEKRTTQNKQYAAEVLAITLQSSSKARAAFLANKDGLDAILQSLARYRKHDPAKDHEDEEFVENLFDALTCLADTDAGKRHFRATEGTELMLIMLREGGKLAKARALRVLDHALARAPAAERDSPPGPRPEHLEACEALVEAGGLKPLFKALMRAPDAEAAEHALGALASLLRTLPGDSAARIRTLAKCVEKGYQVVRRLVELRRECSERLARVQAGIDAERAELDDADEAAERADEWLSRRLEAGLFTVQTVDVVLAWLVAEDAGAKTVLVRLLSEGGRDDSLADLKATLAEQLDGLKDATDPDEVETADMLKTLSDFLE